MTNLSDRTFRNPSFVPLGSKEAGSVSDHLYEVEALLRTALFAFQNDTTGAPMSAPGIESTLEVALNLLSDLGPEIEGLQSKASETAAHRGKIDAPDYEANRARSDRFRGAPGRLLSTGPLLQS